MLGYKYLVPILLATFAHVAWVESETVDVKYRGTVDLKTFECRDTPRSSFIQRVCYDKAQSYLIINLRGTYYHYCELPPQTFNGLMGAPSMGQFFNQNIKGSGSDGPHDCRTHRVPTYKEAT
jgi:KTSC domain